jgi:phosphate transport system substrate-binding protein
MVSPIIGKADIWCDESLKSIISQQEQVFEFAYPNADVNIHYAPQMEILNRFYPDSLRAIIISQPIDSTTLKTLNKNKIYPKQFMFGKSALAFISRKSSKDTVFTYNQMIDMLSGRKGGKIFAVENSKSGIVTEILKHTNQDSLSKNIYALKSKEDVLAWVNTTTNGIGIVDWSNISDEDDAAAMKFIENVNIIKVGTKDKGKEGNFYGPYQANLNGLYPFTRDLYFVRQFSKTSVSLGFASFICEERGQKIILKAGLLPHYQTERWIEFKGLTDINIVK